MKFVMSERIKHRLTGGVVVLAVAILFLPGLLKKSNTHFEEQMHVSLLPLNKPVHPIVAIPTQQAMFKAIKVAQLNMPKVNHVPASSIVAQAKPLTPIKIIARTTLAKIDSAVKITTVIPIKAEKVLAQHATIPSKDVSVVASKSALSSTSNQSTYKVQLAAFTQRKNAESLVSKLRASGYTASYHVLTKKVQGQQQAFYQVLVGQLHQRNAAIQLQQTLASNVKLNGFVVRTSEIG